MNTAAAKLKNAHDCMVETIGFRPIARTLAISSILFWGLLIVQTLGVNFPANRLATIPMLVMAISLASVWTTTNSVEASNRGIVVVKQITLRSGDGSNFESFAEIENADGQTVATLNQRGAWNQIRTPDGKSGWLKASALATID